MKFCSIISGGVRGLMARDNVPKWMVILVLCARLRINFHTEWSETLPYDMERDTANQTAKIIHAVSEYFELPVDDENKISKCLRSSTTVRSAALCQHLKILLRMIKSNTSENTAFWKSARSNIKMGILTLSGHKHRAVRSSIPITLRKSDSSKDVRSVLNTTDLKCPVPFWFAAPELLQDSVLKLSEGSFAEVYETTKVNGEKRILKIVPVGDTVPKSEFEQLTFKNMTAEICVSLELSKLSRGPQYRCLTFPNICRICVVQDAFPESLTRAWKSYYSHHSSFHPCPKLYGPNQAFITIETENAGTNLESFKVSDYLTALSIFQQVAAGIAIAEEKLHFEHRDLHSENILLQRCTEESMSVKIKGRNYVIETYGVKASIIDFTYSRIDTDEGVKYVNLDPIYDPNPMSCMKFLDHRYVYAKMADVTEHKWKTFCPRTNILWLNHILKYLLVKICDQGTIPLRNNQKRAKENLNVYNSTCMSYESSFSFVRKEILPMLKAPQ